MTSNVWDYGSGITTRVMYVGDVEKGLAEADYIVEGRYQTGEQDHAAMEPMVSVAYFDDAEQAGDPHPQPVPLLPVGPVGRHL